MYKHTHTHRQWHWFYYLVLYQQPTTPTPNHHQQRLHRWPSLFINLCHLHISHTHIHTETLMQAWNISSYWLLFFFSSLPAYSFTLPLCLPPPQPHSSSFPTTFSPFHFFSRHDVLSHHHARCSVFFVLFMGVFVCLFVSVFELAVRTFGGERVNVFWGEAQMCVCAHMHLCE